MRSFVPLALVAVLLAPGTGRGAGQPRPRFPVGVTVRTFEKTSVTTGAPRPLATTIWYPAVRATGTPDALGLRDAAVRRGRWPLVVFSHGACGSPTAASYLMRALAADGFVAAAPPHPGHTKADGAACRAPGVRVDTYLNRVPDVRFVIDSMLALARDPASPFARRLRRNAVGMTGTSFGGFTTLLVAQREPRVRAALPLVPGGIEALDQGDIAIPTMVIGAEHDRSVGFAASEAAYARLAGPRYLVELLGADHLSVVDDCAPLCGTIAPDEAHRLVVRHALAFFRRYLGRRRGPSAALRRQSPGVTLTADPRR